MPIGLSDLKLSIYGLYLKAGKCDTFFLARFVKKTLFLTVFKISMTLDLLLIMISLTKLKIMFIELDEQLVETLKEHHSGNS